MKRLIAGVAIFVGLVAASVATAAPADALCVSARVGINGTNVINAQPLLCV
jgi:hypothetical protein